jgi:hypothetical protein
MTQDRIAAIEQALVICQAEGRPITNNAIYEVVKGHRADVVGYLKHWRAQQRLAADTPPLAAVAGVRSRAINR